MASSAANTPSTYYIDTSGKGHACEKDFKEVEKKCAPDDKNKHRGKGRPKKRGGSDSGSNDASWVLDHCGPLMVYPQASNFEEWYSEFKDIDGALKKLASELGDKVITKLERESFEYAGEKAAKLALRRGLTGWIPVVGWIATAVDVAVTAVDVASRVTEMQQLVADLKETVSRLQEQANRVRNTLGKHGDKLKDFGKLSAEEQKAVASEVMVDVQSAYAVAQPCLRARKCTLVPFNKGSAAKWAGQGCCPGQTGHHLLPDAMFRDPAGSATERERWRAAGNKKPIPRSKLPKKSCWDSYSEGASPTICAEGVNQYSGSHGAIHAVTDKALKTSPYANQSEMPYTTARDLALAEVSRLYGCNMKCLQAQLDAYYCDKAASKQPNCPDCRNAKVVPNSGVGVAPEEPPVPDDVIISTDG